MEVSALSRDMIWSSGSYTLDNTASSMMFAADGNVAPSHYYQRLFSEEDIASTLPGYNGGCSADDVLSLDDLEQQLDCNWEGAAELIWPPSEQQMPVNSAPQHQPWETFPEELQCPPTSHDQTVVPVAFPTAEESAHETGGKQESRLDENGYEESGGDCSDDHIDAASESHVLQSGERIGVTYHKKNKQWESHLWIKGHRLRGRKKKGVQIFLGNFQTEDEAKEAHDRAAIKLRLPPSARGEPYPLNFPAAAQASYMEEHADWTNRDFLWKIRRTSNKFSKGKSSLKGVTVRKRSVKRGQEWVPMYQSKLSLTAKECGDDLKQTFELGNFECEEEAGQAYDRALLFLHQHLPEVEQLRLITNYRPSSYSAEDINAMAGKLPCMLPREE